VTLEETLWFLEVMASSGVPAQVVTVNPEFIMTAQQNEEFRQVLNEAELSIPDGMGVILASRLFGRPFRERVAGVDVVERFAPIASQRGFRLFLLGAAPGVAELAAEVLKKNAPGLIIAGTYSGSPSPEEEEEICRRIAAASPHVLLVAYGAPNQDLWIARVRKRMKIPVCIGVGGTLDYISGVVTRAPRWIQAMGLEWLYRLVRQPTRWRRMLALPRFAMLIALQWATARRGKYFGSFGAVKSTAE
jgi:N-acetylglucosaminyldiphosphoundecaprenol N-acetyl-beta-D-mannosaminyltransferase